MAVLSSPWWVIYIFKQVNILYICFKQKLSNWEIITSTAWIHFMEQKKTTTGTFTGKEINWPRLEILVQEPQDSYMYTAILIEEEFEDTKGVSWSESIYQRKTDNTISKEKVQLKDKQRSTKHTHKTKDRSNTNPTKNRGWTQMLPKGKQFLFH